MNCWFKRQTCAHKRKVLPVLSDQQASLPCRLTPFSESTAAAAAMGTQWNQCKWGSDTKSQHEIKLGTERSSFFFLTKLPISVLLFCVEWGRESLRVTKWEEVRFDLIKKLISVNEWWERNRVNSEHTNMSVPSFERRLIICLRWQEGWGPIHQTL